MREEKLERKLRIILFEDDKNIRTMLKLLFEKHECEILTFEDPSLSQIYQSNDCQCNANEVCADIMITDIDMPHVSGLDFIEGEVEKGCKIKNFAIISGFMTNKNIKYAENLGVTIFYKPTFFFEISEWIDKCFEKDKRNLNLSNWFLDKNEVESSCLNLSNSI